MDSQQQNQPNRDEPEDDRSERWGHGVHGACVWPVYIGIIAAAGAVIAVLRYLVTR